MKKTQKAVSIKPPSMKPVKPADPYHEFRFFLSPVRCSMGGGPAGCYRIIGRYQAEVDDLLDQDLAWPDIFARVEETQRKKDPGFYLDNCCRQSIMARTPHYERFEGKPNTEDYTLLGTQIDREAPYKIHGRNYRIDAKKGVVFTGYGPRNTPTVQEADRALEDVESDDDAIMITADSLEDDDELIEKHKSAIDAINQLI